MASHSKNAQRAAEVVITSFTRHWRALHARIRLGEDVAAAREHAFLARTPGMRLRLARTFYSQRHAVMLADLTHDQVREQLGAWIDTAVEYALSDSTTLLDWGEQKAFLAGLVEREYVTIVEPWSGTPHLDRYPGDAGCDDLYERTAAGCSTGGVLHVHKSTGEAFGKAERRSGVAAIRSDILEVAASDDGPGVWSVSPCVEDDVRVVSVDVSE